MRPINITQAQLTKQIKEQMKSVLEQISSKNLITYTFDLSTLDQKLEYPILLEFTPKASHKMTALVAEADVEVAWHGIINRTETGFIVEDIVIYPQIASAVTVESDDSYGPWLSTLSDENFNRLRLQGHSHVNMEATPSSVDYAHQELLVKDIKDYYIFMIVNKRGNMWVQIYDIEKGFIYEHSEIEIRIEEDPYVDWAQYTLKTMVQKLKRYMSPHTTSQIHPLHDINVAFFEDEDEEDYYRGFK